MTDAIKMAEMQRANIEFERQRHLANWLIKSSAHMAQPVSTPSSSQPPILSTSSSQQKLNLALSSNNKNSISIKNGTATQSPMFFMNGHNQKSSLSKPPIFTSQTNLPLSIVTQSPDGQKPKLRRFNSHDTSANMFSVVDFENARLARRNEIERQKYKMNSLSSGGDCSTGDSKGSKFSNDSNPEPLPANIFLERYSLPRVIRLKYNDKFNTLLSSSSNDSSLSSDKKVDSSAKSDLNGELFLLYRHVKNRKIYHGFNSKNGANKKKGVKIPQEYQGYFSLINERGQPTATMYTTIIQLVRERVYKFITVDNMTAYTEQTTDTFPTKSHYVKGTAKAGQVFRLLAVFQDGGSTNGMNGQHHHSENSNNSLGSQKDIMTNSTGREKERGRYAQLLGDNRQVVYVSLSLKGKFYEIEQSTPQILQRSSSLGKPPLPKKINPDCIQHISTLVTDESDFPINLKFISGPSGCGNPVPENLTITRMSTENTIIVCPIDETENRSPLHLRKLQITSEMVLTKCYLGFENEQRMFTNQNVQNLLKFCQFNCENFQRLIEIEYISNHQSNINQNHHNHSNQHHENSGLKILRPLNFAKFLNRDKSGHEKEESIIFLSKNDLDNLEIQQQQKQLRKEEEDDTSNNADNLGSCDHQTFTDKMKVFQPSSTKKKWFKNFTNKNSHNNNSNNLTINYKKSQSSSFTSLHTTTTTTTSLDFVDIETKRRSMDRYQDMSKLLQERFGDGFEIETENSTKNNTINNATKDDSRPSSDIGINNPEIPRRPNLSNLTKKSMSLQDVVDLNRSERNNFSIRLNRNEPLPATPDLLKIEKQNQNDIQSYAGDDYEHDDQSEINSMSYNNQQSFISQKLYTEFHVKTKQHSKSSSNLHQLLHFAVPQKMTVNDLSKKKQMKLKTVTLSSLPPIPIPLTYPTTSQNNINTPTTPKSPQFFNSHLTIEDELPYSNVRDSLITDQETKNNVTISNNQSLLDVDCLPIENIYAEICNDNSTNLNSHRGDPAFGSIRISIPTTNHQLHTSDHESNTDNIYNTIQ